MSKVKTIKLVFATFQLSTKL